METEQENVRPMESIGSLLSAMRLTAASAKASGSDSEHYACSICKDFGRVHPRLENGRADYSRVVPCHCRDASFQEERKNALLTLCRLPASADRMTFHTFQTGKVPVLVDAYNTALALAQETGGVKWLTLAGLAGRGKTHLALSVCHEWLRRGRPARYAFTPLLLKELRDGFDLEGEQSYRVRFNFFCDIPLLVLDDLGVEAPTAWGQEQLQTIIHYRWLNALPLVVTTNRPLDNLVGDPEHRIGSRLQRESWCRVVHIDTPEYRNSPV